MAQTSSRRKNPWSPSLKFGFLRCASYIFSRYHSCPGWKFLMQDRLKGLTLSLYISLCCFLLTPHLHACKNLTIGSSVNVPCVDHAAAWSQSGTQLEAHWELNFSSTKPKMDLWAGSHHKDLCSTSVTLKAYFESVNGTQVQHRPYPGLSEWDES